MSDQLTKKDVESIVGSAVDKAVTDLTDVIQTFMFQVDDRFNKLEARMDVFDEKLDKLMNTIDGFVKRLDEVEGEQTARDAQFARLLTWARKVSAKTGIPLENL